MENDFQPGCASFFFFILGWTVFFPFPFPFCLLGFNQPCTFEGEKLLGALCNVGLYYRTNKPLCINNFKKSKNDKAASAGPGMSVWDFRFDCSSKVQPQTKSNSNSTQFVNVQSDSAYFLKSLALHNLPSLTWKLGNNSKCFSDDCAARPNHCLNGAGN